MIFKLRILFYYLSTRYLRKFKSRSKLEHWQGKKIENYLTWLAYTSPFYQKYQGLKLEALPIMDKKSMMKEFNQLNTLGIDRDEALALALKAEEDRDFTPTLRGATVGLSSGTSGNRGLFLVSDRERARYAGTMLAKVLPGSLLSKNRVAFFMRANSNLYTASKSSRLRFEFFDLFIPIQDQIEKLNALAPTLLFAPPSVLIQLAKLKNDSTLTIAPTKILSIAETLDPLDEMKIEIAFQQKVHQVYQCTEGFLGITCAQGTLHLNEDCIKIEPEWLDEAQTKFIPIITDFSRTSQPMVRYRLNDILTRNTSPCTCGSALMSLECIEGRADDLFYFRAIREENDAVQVFPDFIRRAIMRASPDIEEYLVRQQGLGEVLVSLKIAAEKRESAELQVSLELQKLSRSLNASMPGLRFSVEFPELNNKKLRRVIREY